MSVPANLIDFQHQEIAEEGLLGPPPSAPDPEAWRRYVERRDQLMESSNRRMLQQQALQEQLFRFAQEFLVSVGNVSKFFFPIGVSGQQRLPRDPVRAQHIRTRRERGRILRQLYEVPDTSPLSDADAHIRELRNSIEHYDERIDMWAELNVRVTGVRSIGLTTPGQGDFFNIHPHLDAISFFGQYYAVSPVVNALQAIHLKSIGEAGLLLGWRLEADRAHSGLKGVWVERAHFERGYNFSRDGVMWRQNMGLGGTPIPLPIEFYIDETVELHGTRCAVGHAFADLDGGKWCEECRIWYSNVALQEP